MGAGVSGIFIPHIHSPNHNKNKTSLTFHPIRRATMAKWLSCWTHNTKVLCSNLVAPRHGMTVDKSLTAICVESPVRSRLIRSQKIFKCDWRFSTYTCSLNELSGSIQSYFDKRVLQHCFVRKRQFYKNIYLYKIFIIQNGSGLPTHPVLLRIIHWWISIYLGTSKFISLIDKLSLNELFLYSQNAHWYTMAF